MYGAEAVSEERSEWNPEAVRALRRRLGMTQQEMADELGARQQTVSEWETGVYKPRGVSARALLRMAEASGAPYRAGGGEPLPGERGDAPPDSRESGGIPGKRAAAGE